MPRVIGFWIASLLFCPFAALPAEAVPEKSLFVTRVEALKPLKDEKQTAPEKGPARRETNLVSEFVLETATTMDVSIEARAQQISAMNGTPLVRSAPRAPAARASSGIGRALDLLLPAGKPLLSKNPNARRDPLSILEE
jgi:hypothetical protein